MRDISTMVRDYYDTAAVPVTVAEAIAHTAADDDRRPVPNWVLAVAVATVVIVVLGGLSFLLGGSESSIPPAGTAPPVAPTPAIEGLSFDPDGTPRVDQATVWMRDRYGVQLAVTPPILPPVPGTYDVIVHGYRPGEQPSVDIFVAPCPGVRGVVNVNDWLTSDDVNFPCLSGYDQEGSNPRFIDGVFETTLRIEIDEAAIEDGGIVMTAGDIWVPHAGNVLLRIADQPQTPWEHAFEHVNVTRLASVVSYWPRFVSDYDTTYAALGTCDAAYADAQAGQRGYHDALDNWDDTQHDKPGYAYDNAVARLVAGTRWLDDHTCPGRFDFVNVG